MANRFVQNQLTQRQIYEQKYRVSRMNLLLVIAFTLINIVILVANLDTYFLFSAFIPYAIATIGMMLCGRLPEEYYPEELNGMIFLDNSFFVAMLIVAIVLTLLYLLAWIMSGKNRVGWLIFALVFFGLDTLGMLVLNGISLGSAFDILFHGWVIYELIVGIVAHNKLKNLPPEEVAVPDGNVPLHTEVGGDFTEPAAESAIETPDSPILRRADMEAKHRVLLQTKAGGYDVCYRRIKHTNELVINGNVYDELEGIVETSHTLSALVGGHRIDAGYDGVAHSFIILDGTVVAKKIRLF